MAILSQAAVLLLGILVVSKYVYCVDPSTMVGASEFNHDPMGTILDSVSEAQAAGDAGSIRGKEGIYEPTMRITDNDDDGEVMNDEVDIVEQGQVGGSGSGLYKNEA